MAGLEFVLLQLHDGELNELLEILKGFTTSGSFFACINSCSGCVIQSSDFFTSEAKPEQVGLMESARYLGNNSEWLKSCLLTDFTV